MLQVIALTPIQRIAIRIRARRFVKDGAQRRDAVDAGEVLVKAAEIELFLGSMLWLSDRAGNVWSP